MMVIRRSHLGGLLLLQAAASAPTLKQVTYFSRHGVRTPYPPSYGTATDWRNYTNLAPPGAAAYNGMSQEAFETQQLTPHGAALIPLVGSYFRAKWANASLFAGAGGCDAVVAFADDSTRDVQTAAAFLDGFGCGGATPVHVANASLPAMAPVCSDHYDTGCALATEEQVAGLYGGSVSALTSAYSHLITRVQQVLQMPADAGVCRAAGAAPATWQNCTLYDLPYVWTGMYWQGMFVSPLYYAQVREGSERPRRTECPQATVPLSPPLSRTRARSALRRSARARSSSPRRGCSSTARPSSRSRGAR